MKNENQIIIDLDGVQAELAELRICQERNALQADIHIKEQNRHLARIATALEALVGGTKLGEHAERYTQKLEEASAPIEAKQPAEPVTDVVKEFTHDDLKSLCMTKSREDGANKAKLKALLSAYGASKASDVPNAKLAEIIAKINAGEF